MSLNICSLNVKGLQDSLKRRAVFNTIRDKRKDIYLLQEVHCGPEQGKMWKNEWGGRAWFSEFSRNSVGVAILVDNSCDIDIHDVQTDPEGRFIALDCSVNNKRLTICNIYGPNKDSPAFFNKINTIVEDLKNLEIILAGDFNLVQDPKLDKQGGTSVEKYKESQAVITKIMEDKDLIDPYRVIYPTKKEYTWRQRKPLIQCRLDYFLISSSLFGIIDKCNIKPGFKTDHSFINISLKLDESLRGRGFWKLNCSLLKDHEYVYKIKQTIKECNELDIEPQLKWEYTKLECRWQSIQYSALKRRRDNKIVLDLEKEIELKEKALNEESSPVFLNGLEDKKKHLESIQEKRT